MLVRFTLVLLAATPAASSPVVAAARPRLPCRRLPHQPAQSCLSLRGGSAGGAAAFVGDYTKASVLGTVVSRGGWLAGGSGAGRPRVPLSGSLSSSIGATGGLGVGPAARSTSTGSAMQGFEIKAVYDPWGQATFWKRTFETPA